MMNNVLKSTGASLLFIVLVAVFGRCSSHQPPAEVKTSQPLPAKDTVAITKTEPAKTVDTIKKEIVKPKTNTIDCEIMVSFTNCYCGGARPSDEILDSYKTIYPLINSTIELRKKGSKNAPLLLSTDYKGMINTTLEKGTYQYYMTKKYSTETGCMFSSSCDVWLKQSFGEITIGTRQNNKYTLVYSFNCNPCEPPRP